MHSRTILITQTEIKMIRNESWHEAQMHGDILRQSGT